jgi:cell wall assembly regulator SMI1
METVWARIESWLKENAQPVFEKLNPGATEAEISAAEKYLRQSLPSDVKALYRFRNGQAANSPSLFYGFRWFDIAAAANAWTMFDGEPSCEPSRHHVPDPGVKKAWTDAGWVPFMWDGTGDYHCIDLAPAEGGTVGQIISFLHDSDDRPLLASSLEAFLEEFAAQLEQGKLVYVEEDAGIFEPG